MFCSLKNSRFYEIHIFQIFFSLILTCSVWPFSFQPFWPRCCSINCYGQENDLLFSVTVFSLFVAFVKDFRIEKSRILFNQSSLLNTRYWGLIREFKIYDATVAKTSLKIASSTFSIYFAIMSVCLTFES